MNERSESHGKRKTIMSQQHLQKGTEREDMKATKHKLGRRETVQEVERKPKEQGPTDATGVLHA